LSNKKAAKNFTIFDSFQKKKKYQSLSLKEYVVAINQKNDPLVALFYYKF